MLMRCIRISLTRASTNGCINSVKQAAYKHHRSKRRARVLATSEQKSYAILRAYFLIQGRS
jgi:hypothetical protein